MRISDWSSDVCSSDLRLVGSEVAHAVEPVGQAGDALVLHGFEHGAALVRLLEALRGRHVVEQEHQVEQQLGRASCRERVCQYVYISVAAVTLKQNQRQKHTQ